MPVRSDEIIQDILHPFVEALDSVGVTTTFLAKKIKAELNAKHTETFKGKEVKVHVDPETNQKKIIAIDTVIYSKPMKAWDIRQKARMDAHRLRGDYPPERKFVETNGNQLANLLEALSAGPVKKQEEKTGETEP